LDNVEAKAVIDRVFRGTGILRVISIDDDYELPLDIGDLVVKCLELAEKGGLEALLAPYPGLYAPDADLLSRRLRTFWNDRSPAEIKQLYALVSAAGSVEREAEAGDAREAVGVPVLAQETESAGRREAGKVSVPAPEVESADEREAVRELPVLFEQFQFRTLSLPEWLAQSEKVLADARTNRTLIMFDQDMSNHGGSPIEGIIQIKETLSKTDDGSVVCCLLSHKHHAATLFETWKAVCDEHGLPMSVVVIAKDSLKKQPEQFASQLKLSAVSPHYDCLRARALEIFKRCMDVSSQRVSALHIADLDHIVYVSSTREGVWEPDTLFRLMAIYHRSEMRDQAMTDKEIQDCASVIRSISGIDTGPSLWKASPAVWKAQHLENYEPQSQLNALHRPTDLGDIYERTDGRRRYILIAPQCDLMVRTKAGFRGEDSDQAKEGVLAEIVNEQPRPGLGWKLDFYSEGREAWVHFKKTFSTRLIQLDYCVFNPAGKAEMSVGGTPPDLLIPAWKKRHAIAIKDVKHLITIYERINPCGAQKNDVNKLLTRANNECIFCGTIDPTAQSITMNFNRVSRLLPPRSTALVKAYSEFLNRDAFEHPFAKEC
jgi:hypothetical protein